MSSSSAGLNPYPLLERSPRLAGAVPVTGLVQQATAVQPLAGAAQVWLKRDDLSASDYGGNKIRKLDFLLAGAKARGARELLTFGYAGSNFVAATAWHGRKLGLNTAAFLLPQIKSGYVADNLSVGLHAGAQLQLRQSTAAVVRGALLHSAGCLLRQGRLPAWIPPGGSSPQGVLGFVNAALELKQQVDAGLLPAPSAIYVAFSSMGTVAGLALGLELARLSTRINAVQVVDERFATHDKLQGLMQQSCRYLRSLDTALTASAEDALERVQIRREYFGEEYGRPTPQTAAAIHRFVTATGARADSAYSGKALACLYDDLDRGRLGLAPVLFWHTFNAHGLPPGVRHPPAHEVPPALQSYFVA